MRLVHYQGLSLLTIATSYDEVDGHCALDHAMISAYHKFTLAAMYLVHGVIRIHTEREYSEKIL